MLRYELILRIDRALRKRGHATDINPDELESPNLGIDGKAAHAQTCYGCVFTTWYVSVDRFPTGPKERPEWWYTLERHFVEQTDAHTTEHHDPYPGARPVARCRNLRHAARLIDDHLCGTALLTPIHGPYWHAWRSYIRPITQRAHLIQQLRHHIFGKP